MAGYVMRSDWPLFMTPGGLRSLKRRAWEPTESLIKEFRTEDFHTDTTNNAYDSFFGTVGLGRVVRKPETTPKRFDAPRMGRPFTMVYPTYALAVGISREAQEDDQTNELVPMITRELKRAVVEAQEEDAAAQWSDGFDYQGWETDGVALFSTAHPLLRNQSGSSVVEYSSNRHATDAALSITSLDAAYSTLRQTKNDTGRWLTALMPKRLVVHPQGLPYALQIVGTQKVLGSNYNDKNLYYQDFEVNGGNPRLRYPNAWYLESDNHKWLWMTRRAADFDTDIDKIADVTVLMTSARWGRGASDWRGKWASKGP